MKEKNYYEKNPYVIQMQTMFCFLYPQSEEKGMKIGKLRLSIYVYKQINNINTNLSLYIFVYTVSNSIHITDVWVQVTSLYLTSARQAQ